MSVMLRGVGQMGWSTKRAVTSSTTSTRRCASSRTVRGLDSGIAPHPPTICLIPYEA